MTSSGLCTGLRNARHFLVAAEFLLRLDGNEDVDDDLSDDYRVREGEGRWVVVRGRKEVGIVFCFVQRVGGHHDDRIEHKRGAPGGVTGHKIPLRPPFSTLASRCRGLPVFPYKTCHRPCPFLISLSTTRPILPSKFVPIRSNRSLREQIESRNISSSRFQRRSDGG